MEKKPLSADIDINADDKALDSTIKKKNQLLESLQEANRLIREINEIEPDKILNTSTGKE